MLDGNEIINPFSQVVKEPLRTSSTSTTDSLEAFHWQSEEIDTNSVSSFEPLIDFSNSCEWLLCLKPSQAIGLLTPMSDERQERYITLRSKLEKVLEFLDDTVSSVNIRDECSFQATSVNLAMPINSRLLRSRTNII